MGQLPDRIAGTYAAEYNWAPTMHHPPSADVIARVVQGLHALDSESSRRRGDALLHSRDPRQEWTVTEYRTVCDGWAAVWQMDHSLIHMMHVGSTVPGRPPLMKVDAPGAAPDLVIARELFPNLTRLWDAVRKDYWHHLSGPRAGSTP